MAYNSYISFCFVADILRLAKKQTNFVVYWMLLDTPPLYVQWKFLYIINLSFDFKARTVCKLRFVGVNTSRRPEN